MIVKQRNALLLATLVVCAATSRVRAQNSGIHAGNPAAGPTVDGSSERAFRESMKQVRLSLPSDERWQADLVLEYAAATLPDDQVRATFGGKNGQDMLGMAAMLIERYDVDRSGALEKRERDELRSDLADARIQRHEQSVIESLKELHAAQAKLQADLLIDINGDELGEFAYIAEMTGAVTPRGGNTWALLKKTRDKEKAAQGGEELIEEQEPEPLLPDTWQVVDGRVALHGYYLQMWLPDLDLLAVAEGPRGGVGKRPPGPATACSHWVVVAWPQEHEISGRRAFCITQDGAIFETDNLLQRYSGNDKAPEPFAAFARGTGKFGAALEQVKASNDGGQWKRIP